MFQVAHVIVAAELQALKLERLELDAPRCRGAGQCLGERLIPLAGIGHASTVDDPLDLSAGLRRGGCIPVFEDRPVRPQVISEEDVEVRPSGRLPDVVELLGRAQFHAELRVGRAVHWRQHVEDEAVGDGVRLE
jgi:hypothetical protein